MKTTIQIKSIFGKLLFEFEKENNTVKDTVLEAIKQSANLQSADLRSADLRFADLQSANLRSANLQSADLQSADLRSANLHSANLRSADLRSADLQSADLRSADLRSANLLKAYSQNTILPEGDLIVWKKLQKQLIAKLLIPSNAKRVNAIGSRKCRFEFAKVLDIRDDKGHSSKTGIGKYDKKMIYTIGEMIYPDSFDDSPLIECSHGIHGFITRLEAKEYE
jgi:hypothetical protein